jgi:hypothetical protein
MVEALFDPGEVAGRAPATGCERSRVDLVEDRALPPWSVHGNRW